MSDDHYVDIHNGKLVLFDGKSFLPTNANSIFGTNSQNEFVIDTLVGILHLSSNRVTSTGKTGMIKKEFTPFLKRYTHLPKFLIKTKKVTSCADQCVIVKIESIKDGVIHGCVSEYIGEMGSQEIDIMSLKMLASSHWSKKLDKQFAQLATTDLTPQRTILSNAINKHIVSVDPYGCEDIDDALHCVKTDDGYEVGIHIADVSSYIEVGSQFDNELAKRVESVYFDNSKLAQLNMIPNELSIKCMSLKEGNPKRAFSVFLQLDANMDIRNVRFEKTLIVVNKNMSYDEYTEQLKSNEKLTLLYNVGEHLKKNISNAFSPHDAYDTHQMVAVFMIYANKYVAEKINNYDPTNVLLRTQHMEQTQQFTENIDKCLIEKYNVSTLERAYYKRGSENGGHSGMNLQCYTHFTSPIRRYADILVHRQLLNVLGGNMIVKILTKTLFLMNTYSRLYKQIQRYSHVIDVIYSKNFENTVLETFAHVVSIRNTNNSVRLYIPELGIDHDVQLVSRNFEQLFEVDTTKNSITIKENNCNNEHTNKLVIKLFQQVKVKIAITKKSFEKIHVAIIEPNLILT